MFPQQTLDALPTNASWWLKASNRSTQQCVFHRATYKDVGMGLNLNRLIVSAPFCIYTHVTVAKWIKMNLCWVRDWISAGCLVAPAQPKQVLKKHKTQVEGWPRSLRPLTKIRQTQQSRKWKEYVNRKSRGEEKS